MLLETLVAFTFLHGDLLPNSSFSAWWLLCSPELLNADTLLLQELAAGAGKIVARIVRFF